MLERMEEMVCGCGNSRGNTEMMMQCMFGWLDYCWDRNGYKTRAVSEYCRRYRSIVAAAKNGGGGVKYGAMISSIVVVSWACC